MNNPVINTDCVGDDLNRLRRNLFDRVNMITKILHIIQILNILFILSKKKGHDHDK